MQAPLAVTYAMHFESLDGNKPKIAETVDEVEEFVRQVDTEARSNV